MLIPQNFFMKEADHIEGFALNYLGSQKSATKTGRTFGIASNLRNHDRLCLSDWINSYRDLPYEINQWANVFRWEKKTLPFLRTSEFLWQEGHTAHENEDDARQRTMKVLDEYARLCEEFLAIPVYRGQKPHLSALQGSRYLFDRSDDERRQSSPSGTSHYMGTKFAEAFDITYLTKENKHTYAHTTSWGVSTRLLGALIMTHGDENGLVFPPTIAPTQVVLLPVGPWKKNPAILEKLEELYANFKAKGIRVRLDDSDNSPGYKFNEWELKGACLRIECGPRDLEAGKVMVKSVT